MTVPPPYDPVLLREHAFYDSHLKSLVIAPGTNDGSFHAVAEKGLGLFGYRFAENYEVDKLDNCLQWDLINLLILSSCFFGIYMVLNYLLSKKRHSISSHTVTTPIHLTNFSPVQDLLSSPFPKKPKHDIESSPDMLPMDEYWQTPLQSEGLSNSLTNTPKTPNQFQLRSGLNKDNSILLRFIENDQLQQKIH